MIDITCLIVWFVFGKKEKNKWIIIFVKKYNSSETFVIDGHIVG